MRRIYRFLTITTRFKRVIRVSVDSELLYECFGAFLSPTSIPYLEYSKSYATFAFLPCGMHIFVLSFPGMLLTMSEAS